MKKKMNPAIIMESLRRVAASKRAKAALLLAEAEVMEKGALRIEVAVRKVARAALRAAAPPKRARLRR